MEILILKIILSEENIMNSADEKKINEDYEALISGNGSGKLTGEQIEQISQVLKDQEEDSIFLQTMKEFDENHIEEQLQSMEEEPVTVDATINPETGLIDHMTPVMDSDKTSDLDDEDLVDYMKVLDEIPVQPSELTSERISKSVEENYGEELSNEELLVMMKAVKKFETDKKVTYADMPQSIKTKISQTIVQMKDAHGNAIYIGNPELRNQMATAFTEAVIQESLTSEISDTMINLQDEINRFKKTELSKVYSNTMLRQRHILEHDILDIAKEVEVKDPEKAELMRGVSRQFTQSYMYEDMYKTCRDSGKLRVKKFELEKPKRVYDDFNMKYLKSKYSNKDISIIEPVLRRNLPETIDDMSIRKFIIVFCKYCRNMNPNNLLDHTFMSYFITNITGLDLFNQEKEEEKAFYDLIVNNIIKFIDLIKMKETKK